MPSCADRKAGFEDETPILRSGDLLRQTYRGPKVPVLAYDDGDFVLLLIGCPHQIQSQADIHAFLLTTSAHPAPIHVYPPASQMPELVGPESVPEPLGRARSRIRYACVEANLRKDATRNPGDESVRQPLNVIARPCVWRRWVGRDGRPSGLRQVIEVLTVDENDGAHCHQNTRPGTGPRPSSAGGEEIKSILRSTDRTCPVNSAFHHRVYQCRPRMWTLDRPKRADRTLLVSILREDHLSGQGHRPWSPGYQESRPSRSRGWL